MEKELRIAINGCGRIGGAAAKILLLGDYPGLRLVAINDRATTHDLQQFLQRDSVYGVFPLPIRVSGSDLLVASHKIKTFNQDEPAKLPWAKLKIDVVIESTGSFTTPKNAHAHIRAGAKKVLISTAPKMPIKSGEGTSNGSNSAGYTVCGTDKKQLEQTIITHGSCTTSAVAPVLCMLRERFSIKAWTLFAVQSVTHSQEVVDKSHGHERRRRQALDNIIPISLDTDRAIPQLFKTGGIAQYAGQGVRVPTSIVHLAVMTVQLREKTTADQLNRALSELSRQHPWRGIVRVTHDPLVSQDLRQSTESAIIDAGMTKVAGDSLAQIGIWYDNEWAFAQRLIDVLASI